MATMTKSEILALVKTAAADAATAVLAARDAAATPAAQPEPQAAPVSAKAQAKPTPAQPATAVTKAPVKPEPMPAPSAMRFQIRPWIGANGQPMVELVASGRKKGVHFASQEALDAYVDGLHSQADAVKAAAAGVFNG